MSNYTTTPDNLPVPLDDGATDHLLGMTLPSVKLASTQGGVVDLSALPGYVVIYCYPMTGQPGVPLPEGWDDIPGARGCTPQNMCYRDHYSAFQALGAQVFGLSVQSTAYQQEMAQRLQLPFAVLSDLHLAFAHGLQLPLFQAAGMQLIKRLTLIAKNGKVVAVKYPIFPSNSDASWALDWLGKQS
ncbi:MAG: peroxiredoxin [Limnohabitans sp.]